MEEKKPNYTIEGKSIIFDVEKITQREMKQIKKLADGLGYTLVPIVAPKEKKEAKAEWKESAVRAYLEKYGSKAQKERFEAIYNTPLKNGKVYKTDSKDGKHKKGEPRVKGYIATLQWFKQVFPNYPEAPKE